MMHKSRYTIQYFYKDSFGQQHSDTLSAKTEKEFIIKFIDLIFSKPIDVYASSSALYNHQILDAHYYQDVEYFKELRKKYNI